jgi:hypothetical protein
MKIGQKSFYIFGDFVEELDHRITNPCVLDKTNNFLIMILNFTQI